MSYAQIDTSDFVVVRKLARVTVTNDAAVLQHVNALGDGERAARVLLHQQYGGPLALDLPNRIEDFDLEALRDSDRRLVKQQQCRGAHERAPDRQHLLAAGKGTGLLTGARLEDREAVNQVSLADRLVVTKTDLADGVQVTELVTALGSLNALAPIIQVPRTDATPAELFGTDPTRPAPRAPVRDHLHGIVTFSLTCERPVEWHAFASWLTTLKTNYADQLLRVKGVVHVAHEDEPIAINGVHHVFHPPMRLPQADSSDRQSKIVFITRGLPRNVVESGWRRVIQ